MPNEGNDYYDGFIPTPCNPSVGVAHPPVKHAERRFEMDLIEEQLEKIKYEIDRLKRLLLIIFTFCASTWVLIILKL